MGSFYSSEGWRRNKEKVREDAGDEQKKEKSEKKLEKTRRSQIT